MVYDLSFIYFFPNNHIIIPTEISPASPALPSWFTSDIKFDTTLPKKDMLPEPTKSCTAIASANSMIASSVKAPIVPFILFINDILNSPCLLSRVILIYF